MGIKKTKVSELPLVDDINNLEVFGADKSTNRSVKFSASDFATSQDLEEKANEVSNFTEANSRVNITSGDSVTTIWGKIKKWFSDLKTVAFTGSYSDLENRPSAGGAAIVLPDGTDPKIINKSDLYVISNSSDKPIDSVNTTLMFRIDTQGLYQAIECIGLYGEDANKRWMKTKLSDIKSTWTDWERVVTSKDVSYNGILPTGDSNDVAYWINLNSGVYFALPNTLMPEQPTPYAIVTIDKVDNEEQITWKSQSNVSSGIWYRSTNGNYLSGWVNGLPISEMDQIIYGETTRNITLSPLATLNIGRDGRMLGENSAIIKLDADGESIDSFTSGDTNIKTGGGAFINAEGRVEFRCGETFDITAEDSIIIKNSADINLLTDSNSDITINGGYLTSFTSHETILNSKIITIEASQDLILNAKGNIILGNSNNIVKPAPNKFASLGVDSNGNMITVGTMNEPVWKKLILQEPSVFNDSYYDGDVVGKYMIDGNKLFIQIWFNNSGFRWLADYRNNDLIFNMQSGDTFSSEYESEDCQLFNKAHNTIQPVSMYNFMIQGAGNTVYCQGAWNAEEDIFFDDMPLRIEAVLTRNTVSVQNRLRTNTPTPLDRAIAVLKSKGISEENYPNNIKRRLNEITI